MGFFEAGLALLLLASVSCTVAANKKCEFPPVMDCYEAPSKTCTTQFEAANKKTAAALAEISDKSVGAGIAKLLVNGTGFQSTWTLVEDKGDVFISAYSFQAIGFLEDYQYAQATLLLNRADPSYFAAYQSLTQQFDGIFYNKKGGCGVNNTATAQAPPLPLPAAAAGIDSPTRPRLIRTFTAVQSGFSAATGAVNNTISGTVVMSAKVPGQLQTQILPDGRSVKVVFNYQTENLTQAGVFSLQPFFNEHVCYIYPLPIGRGYKPLLYDDALTELWCQQAGLCMDTYNATTFAGPSHGVDGTPCNLWKSGTSVNDSTTFCVTEEGALLDLVYDYHSGGIDIVARTHFANFTTSVDTAAFTIPNVGECVDLRAAHKAADTPVNDKDGIATINREAKGQWTAQPSPVWAGYKISDVDRRLGLLDGYATKLPFPDEGHLLHRAALHAQVPVSFDSRTEWGKACASVMTIRNQGDCGGCWAFSAAETLADRFCIGREQEKKRLQSGDSDSDSGAPNPFSALSLSPQWILDCDLTDHGCGGGLLDDAWHFLEKTGSVQEQCDPYEFCAHPHSPSCEVGPHPPRPTPHQFPCPDTCNATGKAPTQYKAKSAYAVAAPGDVLGIQQEVMAHGPVQVGFQVFSDFMTYHNGTYFRTPSAQGPRGGHAVKIVGWGVDASGTDYWTVANSWSAGWGMGGFFNIRRGTNECGIETTPAAGLPSLPPAG